MNMRKKPHYSGQRTGGNGGNNSNKRRFTRKPGGGGNRYGGGEDTDAVNPRMRKQAQSNREKYLAMGKDALINGDRVESEYYLQHADHYLRIMNAIDAQFAPRPQYSHNQREESEPEAAEMPMPSPQNTREHEDFGQSDGAQIASVLPAPRMGKPTE